MKVFRVGVVAAVAWGALAFGGVYPWAFWSLAVLCAGLGLWAIFSLEAWTDARVRSLAIALAAVALAIGIQAVALPYAIVIRLSPAIDMFFHQFRLIYHPAELQSLSLNQSSTVTALALFVAMALFLVGLTRGIRRVGLEWLAVQILGFGVALAVVGVVQRAFMQEPADTLIYGFWRPVRPGTPFGPYINRNHFAGWMVMALPLVMGYSCGVVAKLAPSPERGWLRWLTSEEAGRPLLLAVCLLVMGMALTLTESRSGIASFAVAMLVMAAFIARRVESRRVRLAATGYVLALVVAAVVWAGAGSTYARFELASDDIGGRVGAWRDTLGIIRDFPVFGTGVGAYRQAMLVYQTQGRERVFAQAHNDYLQVVAEGGLLVVIPVLVLLTIVIRTIVRRLTSGDDDTMTSWIRAGAVAGLVGIAAQSVVEFSLQLPGNRPMFVLLLALALHRPAAPERPIERPERSRSRRTRVS